MNKDINQLDIGVIREEEEHFDQVITAIEASKKFKLNDYLISFRRQKEPRKPVTNSYGATVKYKVVFVDKNGIPYIKLLSKNNKVTGEIMCLVDQVMESGHAMGLYFSVDPEYVDSIIFGDTVDYDAAVSNRDKAALHKQITEHNKSLCIRLNSQQRVSKFIKEHAQVGKQLWRSSVNCWTVVDVATNTNNLGYDKYKEKFVIKVSTSGQKELLLTKNDLLGKVLYKQQPRSYKELQDPNL